MKKIFLFIPVFFAFLAPGLSSMQTFAYEACEPNSIKTEILLWKKLTGEYYTIWWIYKYLKNPKIVFPYLFATSKKRHNDPYNTISIWNINKIKETTTTLLNTFNISQYWYGYKPEKELSIKKKYNIDISEFTISRDYKCILLKKENSELALPDDIYENIIKYQKKSFYYK